MRYPLPNGEYAAALIFSRTRVAPTKQNLSVPRKELNSIVLGVKHLLEIASELAIDVSKLTIHSDSLICLYWLKKSSKDLGVYVWNRVKYIQESEIEILWTASETNVADLVTKDVKPAAHVNSSYWANGPTYLKKPDCDWREERKLEYIRVSRVNRTYYKIQQ